MLLRSSNAESEQASVSDERGMRTCGAPTPFGLRTKSSPKYEIAERFSAEFWARKSMQMNCIKKETSIIVERRKGGGGAMGGAHSRFRLTVRRAWSVPLYDTIQHMAEIKL